MKMLQNIKSDIKTDVTWNRVVLLGAKGARALPAASAKYALDKVPIVGWLPRYNHRWLLNDVIAGLTVGLMLIPQGLSYAKIADIPVQYGLMSSWLPSSVYAVMGTSKDLSVGPTSLIGLLTSEAVEDFQAEYTPSQIASAVALMMGVYGMVLGFLKLGFLLEFISLPILSGFISAVAINIILNQMASLLGEPSPGDGVAAQIHDTFAFLPRANGYACAIGFGGIVFLTILDQAYKRLSKHKVLWFLSITRAFLCLVLFTAISYAVNSKTKDPNAYLFPVVQIKSNGLEAPRMPPPDLIGKVATRSVAVFVGAAVEHTAIARAFGVRHGYVTDQSQELCTLGVTNFVNSFFHAMGVGGAMSRTAVNSACNVRSPLSGLVTTAVVLVSIFKLVGTLYWIPKATLAAIIVCAVWPLISSPFVFYRYWKASLADFVSSMIAFWVSLFVSTSVGIASAVGFNIVYMVLRQVFARISSAGAEDNNSANPLVPVPASSSSSAGAPIPPGARVFRFTDSVFYANAYAVRTAVLDAVQTHHAPAYHSGTHGREAARNWSVVAEQRIARLRRRAHGHGLGGGTLSLPPVGLVVLDFGRANHVDVSAVQNLRGLVKELRGYGGDAVEVRFVGMSLYVRDRFERMGWRVVVDGEDDDEVGEEAEGAGAEEKGPTVLYTDVASALAAPRRRVSRDQQETDLKKMDSELGAVGGAVSHDEKV